MAASMPGPPLGIRRETPPMGELQTIRRVTIYADGVLESTLLDRFQALGSKGYTVVDCRGKGEHGGSVDDPFSASKRVRIEVLVQPAVADAIMEYLSTGAVQHRSVAACVETVQVGKDERF
jgi:hypothetical protein